MRYQNNPITKVRINFLFVCVIALSLALYLYINDETIPYDLSTVPQEPEQTLYEMLEASTQTPIITTEEPVTEESPEAPSEEASYTRATLRGHVYDIDTGEPVKDIKVRVYVSAGSEIQNDGGYYSRSAYTNADGTFEVNELLPLTYFVKVQDSDGLYSGLEHYEKVWIRHGEVEKEIDLFIHKHGIIRGRVTFSDSKEAVAGIPVGVIRKGETIRGMGDANWATTDQNGLYEIGNLRKGEYTVGVGQLECPGFPKGAEQTQNVSIVREMLTQEVNFSLEPGLRLNGVVSAPDGEIENTRILSIVRRNEKVEWHEYVCGLDGKFVIAGLAADDEVTLKVIPAKNSNHLEMISGPYRIDQRDLHGVHIQLDTGAVISGVVLDRIGNPIPRASVRVRSEEDKEYEASCALDGSFTVAGLEQGIYEVYADLSIFGIDRTDSHTALIDNIRFAPKGRYEGLQLVCNLTANTSISGRVTYDTGRPAINTPVYAIASKSKISTISAPNTHTDTKGDYVIDGLIQAQYKLTTETYSYLNGKIENPLIVDAPAKSANIVLHDPLKNLHVIKGQVLDANTGKPIPHFKVGFCPYSIAEANIQACRKQYFSTEVRFVFTVELPKDTFYVGVVADGYTPLRQKIEGSWPEDGDIEETFRLVPGRVLQGRVTDAHGNAITNAKVGVGDLDSNWWLLNNNLTETDASGQFTLSTLPEEPFKLWVTHLDFVPASMLIDPASDTLSTLYVELGSLGTVEGAVFLNGEALTEVKIRLDIEEIPYQRLRSFHYLTNNEGLFRSKPLFPGEYPIMVSTLPQGVTLESRKNFVVVEADKVTQFEIHATKNDAE